MKNTNTQELVQHEYAFDCTLTAAIRVRATSREEAEEKLRKVMDAADCNGGAWPDGEPILFEASVDDGPIVLFQVDGDEVDRAASPLPHVQAVLGQIFARCEPSEIDLVVNRVMGVHPDSAAAGEDFESQVRGTGCIGDAAVVCQEFSTISGRTVADVQILLGRALAADGITDWAPGNAAAKLVNGPWCESSAGDEAHRYLDISTAHISQATMNFLEGRAGSNAIGQTVAAYEYGVFVSVPDLADVKNDVPEDLRQVFNYARKRKCSVVRFDTDGDGHRDLPTFDW
ncbi:MULTISPECIES: hypothetical protein [Herbaspirillum]|uniref:DUF5983 domain-containing protein n=2 Tax=Herbaspirillum huttiense TaxID=863372 RepID=A0AAJ2LVN3_9BURK|nr:MULTISPECIES: hypothetical protein [Herbaspirillum]MDR9836718.1 hypothetical protein [Herbaspirillum huttiense]